MSKLKPYLRWLVFGGTLFFVIKAFKDHWQTITNVRLDLNGWLMLGIALIFTILAHLWSAWVWTWILTAFQQPMAKVKAIQVYLITNIAKYLPGNVWHFYGRITAIAESGGSKAVASIIVLLEPLLMAAAALIIALLSSSIGLIETASSFSILALQILALIIVLFAIHPHLLNPVIHFLSDRKNKSFSTHQVKLKSYPLFPLLGELGFLLWRGTGFLFTLTALMSINPNQIPQLLSVFSFAWLLGLIVPGAPGGLGIFEATTIALLDQKFSAVIILGVAIFRLISIVAEVITAVLASLTQMIRQNFSN